jgi:hypothetical protein
MTVEAVVRRSTPLPTCFYAPQRHPSDGYAAVVGGDTVGIAQAAIYSRTFIDTVRRPYPAYSHRHRISVGVFRMARGFVKKMYNKHASIKMVMAMTP